MQPSAGFSTKRPHFVVAMPLFNDWAAANQLLPRLDEALSRAGLRAPVIVIDDASTDAMPPDFGAGAFEALPEVSILRLRRNLGHQRAIAVGLSYIEAKVPCDGVILLDSDGEDSPSDIPALIERYENEGGTVVVFAERRRRAETALFRVFYHAYRLLHGLLTGQGVRVGNFSVIPRRTLRALVVVSELWNHYAAAVVRARQPYVMVPTKRSKRLDGRSKMSFVSLVVHGFSAISVYGDLVFVRLVVFAFILATASALGVGIVAGIRLFTTAAIPGWATYTSGLLFVIMLQAVLFAASLSFMGLATRQNAAFIPTRDYEYFIEAVHPIEAPVAVDQV